MFGLWLLLTGCHRELKTTGEENPLPEFAFVLSEEKAAAGTEVPYEATFTYSDGTIQRVIPRLSSDLEPSLREGDQSLIATVAGLQTITAYAPFGEGELSATDDLLVFAGPATALDLQLADAQADAGDPIGFVINATDAYGNPASIRDVAYVGSDPTVVVVPPSVTGTIPGIYTVEAQLGELHDRESFRIVAGPAVEVQLSLSDVDLELYETAVAEVRAWDAYDNLIDAPFDLEVSGGDTTIRGDAITFNAEGWYTVTATLDGLSDSVGPFLIDSTGPTLNIDPPERGTFTSDGAGTVAGTATDEWSTITELTINGQSVPVDGSGRFSTQVDYDFGINILETDAMDSDGNPTTDTRAVLAGSFLSYGSGDGDGIDARINQAGFDTLEQIGEDLIASTDLTAMVPNPAYSTSSESCFLGICITWYSITLYVTNPYFSGTDLQLDPDAGGWINTTFTIFDPSIDWQADGSVTGISFSGSGTIYADSITADMDLTPSVNGGVLALNVSNVDVSSSNFTFDWDSWIYDVMSFFGLDLSGLLQGYMETALEGAIADLIPSALGDTLANLQIAYDVPLMDNVYHFSAVPYRASVDDYGMTLGLETWFTADTWKHDTTGAGSLYADYNLPTFASSTPGMQVEISLDFLNQALYALWGGGVLDQQLNANALGLDLSSFGDLLGWSDLNIVTRPLLPPVIVPGTGSGLLDLQLGDLELTLYNGPVDPANIALQVYISAVVDLDLDVTPEGLLSPSIGNIQLFFDAVVPKNNTVYSGDTEDLLSGLLPALLPNLLTGLGSIPVPSIAGFTLSLSSFTLEGPEQGYFSINGDLIAN